MSDISITESEILEEIKNILKNYYLKYAKKTIVTYEQSEGRISDEALHEMRDALDHLAIAISGTRAPEKIMEDLSAAKEHFRRMAIDPIEFLAEQRLLEIGKIRKFGLWWWRFLLIDPLSLDIDNEIHKIIELLVSGRSNKGVNIEKSFNDMWNAYIFAKELNIKTKPAELRSRLFAIGLFLLGFFVKWLLTL